MVEARRYLTKSKPPRRPGRPPGAPAAGRQLFRRQPGQPPGRRASAAKGLPYLLVAPLALFIVGLALIPAAFTIIESFYRANPLDPPTRFDGIGNFRLFASNAVITSFGNTAVYVVVGVVLSTVLGIFFAVVLRNPFRGRGILIAVLILPWALPGVVEGILWTGIYDPQQRPAERGAVVAAPGQPRLGAARRQPLADDLPRRTGAGVADHAVVGAARAGVYAAHAGRAVPGGRDRRLRPVAVVLAHHPAAGPAGHRRGGRAGADRHPQRLQQGLPAQRFATTGDPPSRADVSFVAFQNLDFGGGYALSLLITLITLIISLIVVRGVYRRIDY